MRCALVSVDGRQVTVSAVSGAHQVIRRASTILTETGDDSLGMAVQAALTWEGTAEPEPRDAVGVTVSRVGASYSVTSTGAGTSPILLPDDATAGRIGATVARLLGVTWAMK